ncbi:CHAT domain-containing protein [Ekhidna sp.]|uniref:CHAT domain-containing protein n=1 Tax=Ekhidna sp. TaxID=2608089 RepID=UPI003B50CAD9
MKNRLLALLSIFFFVLFKSFGQIQELNVANNFVLQAVEAELNVNYNSSIELRNNAAKIFREIGDNEKYLNQQFEISKLLMISGKYDKSLQLAQNGMNQSIELRLKDHEDFFRQIVGQCYLSLTRLQNSIEPLEQSLNYRKVRYRSDNLIYAEALNSVARLNLALEENQKAYQYLEEGLRIIQSEGDSSIRTNIRLLHSLSTFYQNVALYKNMLEVNEQALEMCKKYLGENHPLTAQSYYNLASCNVWLREPGKSESNNFKSIQIRELLFGPDYPILAANHNVLASNYYNQNELNKSLESAEEAYRIASLNFGEKHSKTLWAMTYIGKVLNETGKPKEGLELAQKVLDIKKEIYPENHGEIASAYRSVAVSYNFLADYVNAKKYYELYIEIAEKKEIRGASLAQIYFQLAQFNTRLGLFWQGISDANNSFKANNPLVDSVEKYGWPLVEGYETFREYYWAGAFKIYCLYSLADKIPDSSDLYYKAALQGAYFLDSLVLNELRKVTYSEDKFLSSSNSHRAMELGFWSAMYLYNKTKDPIYQEKMLYFNERSKANALLIQSQSRNAKSFAGVPNELIEEQKQVFKNIELKKSEYLSLISNDFADRQQIYDIQNAIYEEENKLIELTSRIKNNHPQYYSVIHETTPVTLTAVQNYLKQKKKKTAILEYLITTGNAYYTLILDDTVKNINVRYEQRISMQSKVMDFRKSVLNVEDTTFSAHSNHLYQLLFDSIRHILNDKNVQSITIVPDGALFYLPFEILPANEDQYLMEVFDISYANSITLLLKEKKTSGSKEVISFAPEFTSSTIASNDVVRGELAKLPGALEEVNTLSEILNNKQYLKQEATETNFKKNAHDYGIIHLATHAIVDEDSPESAKLVFNLENDSLNDGNLYPHEIYNLNLNAQLVTLSACNTGFGAIKKGEGVMSLSRAFAYAGVPATVVSLWPASDKSTPELMKYFYQNLNEGQTKDVALNNARKQYLANAQGKARHPFYWGGFVLIGDNSPIEEDTNLLVYVIPSALIMAMILTVFRRKKKSA